MKQELKIFNYDFATSRDHRTFRQGMTIQGIICEVLYELSSKDQAEIADFMTTDIFPTQGKKCEWVYMAMGMYAPKPLDK